MLTHIERKMTMSPVLQQRLMDLLTQQLNPNGTIHFLAISAIKLRQEEATLPQGFVNANCSSAKPHCCVMLRLLEDRVNVLAFN